MSAQNDEFSRWSSHSITHSLSDVFEFEIRHVPIKRTFDIIFSLFVLIFFFPIFLLISLVIWFTSPGKIIFAHTRIGRGGKLFKCYKFRTMYSDADVRLKHLLESDSFLKEEWEKSYKLKKDPRITPIGSFLRKTSLDELPQFWNVLIGDLSVVGPRPVVEEELIKHFRPQAAKIILSIRPGLTGLWQVSGRSDTSYHTRIKLDEEYVDKHSLFLDIKLIAKTIPCMINSKGAY